MIWVIIEAIVLIVKNYNNSFRIEIAFRGVKDWESYKLK